MEFFFEKEVAGAFAAQVCGGYRGCLFRRVAYQLEIRLWLKSLSMRQRGVCLDPAWMAAGLFEIDDGGFSLQMRGCRRFVAIASTASTS